LTDFINRVEAGETIVVVKGDKPVAEIKPITSVLEEPRPFGLCAGEFIVPDDFNYPVPVFR